MDINKEWQKLEQAHLNQSTIKKEEIMRAIQKESNSTIAALKKNLGQKINWIKLFIGLFILAAALNYSNVGIISIMGVATMLYLGAWVMLKGEYNKLGKQEYQNRSILETLKANRTAIESALNMERTWGVIALPIMMIIGMSYNSFKKGDTFSDIFSSQYSILTVLFFICIVLVAAVAAEKMNKIAFGPQIEKLEEQIKALERVA